MDEIALTIGNFDGVHLGHQALLKRLKLAGPKTAVLTFSNHPSEVLKESPTKLISTIAHKLNLLQMIDAVMVKKFTKELSQLSALQFLTLLKDEIPFSKLILGENARIGHKKEAGVDELFQISKKLAFDFEPFPIQRPLSSSFIRQQISEGNLAEASLLLGRPYSIRNNLQPGEGKGQLLGFRTLNLDVSSLVLPPFGVYHVTVKHGEESFRGVANLGFAPTLKSLKTPLLEVHLIEKEVAIRGEIEVIFHQFIRKEQKFNSFKALQNQISLDVEKVSNL